MYSVSNNLNYVAKNPLAGCVSLLVTGLAYPNLIVSPRGEAVHLPFICHNPHNTFLFPMSLLSKIIYAANFLALM